MTNIQEKIKEHAKQADKGWGLGYGFFSKVIKENNLKTGAEIGVAFGGHSEAILKNTGVEKLYGIDPYQLTKGYKDPMNLPQEEFDKLYNFTLKRLAPFGQRYTHIRKYSKEAINDVPNKIDFVYIDADHSYQGVWKDLCTWFLKVRTGGIIGGHDYGHPNHPGVKQAVDEFFRRFAWQIHTEGQGVWWVKKKPLHISFVMPAYNCEGMIEESVDSIMRNNFEKGDELIIINDASTDKTCFIIKRLQEKYPARAIISLKHNYNKGSASAGRNTGIDNSKNNLIFCLDADNVLYPGSISKLKEFMFSKNADACAFGELHYFKKNIQNVTHKWVYKEEISLYDAINNIELTPCSSGNYLFTKQSWLKAGRYDEFVGGAYDSWAFAFRQLVTGSEMVTMPNSFYYHRYGYESTFIREIKKVNTSLTILQIILPYINLFEDKDINYMMSRKGRYNWFENLEKHPIKLKTGGRGKTRTRPRSNSPLSHILKKLLKRTFIYPLLLKVKKKRKKVGKPTLYKDL